MDDPLSLEYDNTNPVDILHHASQHCLQAAYERGVAGSSTALICVLRNNILKVANLGDCNASYAAELISCALLLTSQCSVIRDTEYIFRSEEQQHSFNYPYQIGTRSKSRASISCMWSTVADRLAHHSSVKKDAALYEVPVQKGDIIILASDGLIDNLYTMDILEEVLKFSKPSFKPETHTPDISSGANNQSSASPSSSEASRHHSLSTSSQMDYSTRMKFSPQRLSETLCSRAKAVMLDPFVVASPFGDKATQQGLYFSGGKTCVSTRAI